jgi:hypothetical protein
MSNTTDPTATEYCRICDASGTPHVHYAEGSILPDRPMSREERDRLVARVEATKDEVPPDDSTECFCLAVRWPHRHTEDPDHPVVPIRTTPDDRLCGCILKGCPRRHAGDEPTPDAKTERIDRSLDGPVEENERGAKQSSSPYLFRGLPPKALRRVARVLKEGAETYEADPFGDVTVRNWHKIPSDSHLEHLEAHWVAYLDGVGDRAEQLASVATRALFALHMYFVEHPEETP